MDHEPAQNVMMRIITAKWLSEPVRIAAELGLADILSEGKLSIGKLSKLTNTYAPNLYRMMRALASVGIFAEDDKHVFINTSLSELLKEDQMKPLVRFFLSEWHDKAWNRLIDSIRTGENAFAAAHGKPCFQWFEDNPAASGIFNEANSYKARTSHRAITDAYDFSALNTITDVGGGYGGLMFEILKAFPSMKGLIADIPQVIKKAGERIKSVGLDERCKTVECDFFNEIPEGGDVYILSNILHDWNDEKCIMILKNCRAVLKKGARILIIEMIVPGGDEFSVSKLLDLEVLVMGDGRERTRDEFLHVINGAGLKLINVIPASENVSILECDAGTA